MMNEIQLEKARIRQRNYRARHLERVRMASRKWVADNREKHKAYNKTWCQENTEKVAIYHKRYREANTDKEAARQRSWRQANMETVREYCRHRIALKHTATIGIVDIEKLISEWNGLCGICDEAVEADYHIDHIIPLSKEGPHSQENLQVTHPICNMRKGNKILIKQGV